MSVAQRANQANEIGRYFADVQKWDVDNYGVKVKVAWPANVKIMGNETSVAAAMVASGYTLKKLKQVCLESAAPLRFPYMTISDSHTVWLYERSQMKRGKKRKANDGDSLGSNPSLSLKLRGERKFKRSLKSDRNHLNSRKSCVNFLRPCEIPIISRLSTSGLATLTESSSQTTQTTRIL